MHKNTQSGEVNPLLISNIITALIAVILAGTTIWAYGNFVDQRDNVQSKIDEAVKVAVEDQRKADDERFREQEKLPTREFVGPEALGRVTFQYPKTWSVFNAKITGGLESFLNPDVVPPISDQQPFAVRVIVQDQAYEAVVKTYEGLVKKGDLKSTPYTINGFSGIRLDGRFSKDREGSAVLFQIRDKTLTIATDSSKFKTDFDNIVMKSFAFNP